MTTPAAKRIADTVRFYDLLGQLEDALGGARTLAACDGRLGWPQRGVYFFFEPGEVRSLSGSGRRVVRVGTHALKARSRATLWNRLSQHRGTADGSGGNHRGSIFRLLIGSALTQRGDCKRPRSWGVAADTRTAAHCLGTHPEAIKESEAGLERRVSAYVGQMPFLWLEIPDAAGPGSERGRIERNAIALLSHARSGAADATSAQWLGRYSDRPLVRASGLWNSNHVEEDYDAAFLDALAAWCARSVRARLARVAGEQARGVASRLSR